MQTPFQVALRRVALATLSVHELCHGCLLRAPAEPPVAVRDVTEAALFCLVPGKFRARDAQARWAELRAEYGVASEADDFSWWPDVFTRHATFQGRTLDAERMRMGIFGGAAFGAPTDSYLVHDPTYEFARRGWEVSVTHVCRQRRSQYGPGSDMALDTHLRVVLEDNTWKIDEHRTVTRMPLASELQLAETLDSREGYRKEQGWGPDSAAPSWSPDGSHIVFAAVEAGSSEILRIRCDGSERELLTNTPFAERSPTYLSDGQRILLWSDEHDAHGEPYLMDRDGTNVRRLAPGLDCRFTTGAAGQNVVSPAGEVCALVARVDERHELFLLHPGQEPQQVTTHSQSLADPHWTADGRFVLGLRRTAPFTGTDLFLVDLSGRYRLLARARMGAATLSRPAADGRFVVLEPGSARLWQLEGLDGPFEGVSARELARIERELYAPGFEDLPAADSPAARAATPAAGAATLLFVERVGSGPRGAFEYDLFSMPVHQRADSPDALGQKQRLTHERGQVQRAYRARSPDGRWLLLVFGSRWRGGLQRLELLDPLNGARRPLAEAP